MYIREYDNLKIKEGANINLPPLLFCPSMVYFFKVNGMLTPNVTFRP